MAAQSTVQFLGAAGTVTGSKHLIRANGKAVLLDCGLFQGPRELQQRNWAAPPFNCNDVNAVVLSHAHIDHTGYLPAIIKAGYRGPIYCTTATADLLSVMLPDSAHLQEEEADHANRHGWSRHKPALPLYTREDADKTLKQLVTREYHAPFDPVPGYTVTYRPSGHILGSATVQVDIAGTGKKTLVFSGDLGRWTRPIIPDPELVPEADVLLMESTYGDKSHGSGAEEQLAQVVKDSAQRGGALLIPAFAVGRTQEITWMLRVLEEQNKIPVLPVYVDSPMAVDVTAMYAKHSEDHDDGMKSAEAKGNPLATRQFHLVRAPEESKKLNDVRGPMIIISASGMANAGRILHHMKLRLPDPKTTVLLAGYQGVGTNGRLLQEGAKSLKIYGEQVAIAAKVATLSGLSAHAGQDELLRWAQGFKRAPKAVHLVHGEFGPANALAALLREKLKWNVSVAKDQETAAI